MDKVGAESGQAESRLRAAQSFRACGELFQERRDGELPKRGPRCNGGCGHDGFSATYGGECLPVRANKNERSTIMHSPKRITPLETRSGKSDSYRGRTPPILLEDSPT